MTEQYANKIVSIMRDGIEWYYTYILSNMNNLTEPSSFEQEYRKHLEKYNLAEFKDYKSQGAKIPKIDPGNLFIRNMDYGNMTGNIDATIPSSENATRINIGPVNTVALLEPTTTVGSGIITATNTCPGNSMATNFNSGYTMINNNYPRLSLGDLGLINANSTPTHLRIGQTKWGEDEIVGQKLFNSDINKKVDRLISKSNYDTKIMKYLKEYGLID